MDAEGDTLDVAAWCPECEPARNALTDDDLTYLLDRVKELEDALEIVNNGYEDFGGSYVNLQVQMSEVEEGRAVLAKREA